MFEILIFLLIYVIAILIFIISAIRTHKVKVNTQAYKSIEIGMSETEMFEIMGKNYSRSLLKNERKKYEWKYDNYSTSYTSKVRKCIIYTRKGIVEEVRPYNI